MFVFLGFSKEGVSANSIAFAIIYFLSGAIFLTRGLQPLISASEHGYFPLLPHEITTFQLICMTVGCSMTLLGFIGMATMGSGRGRLIYGVLQLIFSAATLCVFVTYFPYTESQLEKQLLPGMNATFYGDFGDENETRNATVEWNTLQDEMECCGLRNYNDWENMTSGLPPIPESCCKNEIKMYGCSELVVFHNPAEASFAINPQGCLGKVRNELFASMKAWPALLLGITIFTSVASLLTFVPFKNDLEVVKIGRYAIQVNSTTGKSDTPAVTIVAQGTNNILQPQE